MANDSDDDQHGNAFSAALARVFRQQDRLGRLLDSPASRAMRSVTESYQKLLNPFGSLFKEQERMRGVFDSPLLRAAGSMTNLNEKLLGEVHPLLNAQDRLRDLLDPPATRAVRSALASMEAAHSQHARLADALGESFMSPLAVAAFQSTLGTQAIAVTLKAARCGHLVQRVSLSETSITALARGLDAQPRSARESSSGDFITKHRGRAVDVVRLASVFGVGTPEESRPSIASDVPVEAFRVLDVDAVLNDVSDSASVAEARATLAEETSDELRQLVSELDPDWVAMLDGAREALAGTNPDRLRHALTSLRELFTKALHAVAPTSEVKKWSTDSADLHHGNPTRRARLRYVYDAISDGPLRAFASADICATLELIDLLQKGTHSDRFGASDLHGRILAYRVEGTLLFLLKIGRMRAM